MKITAAADGSALGNPGPAGWGWYIDEHRWASGGWDHGTNNMGELMAVLDLLKQTREVEELEVLCDSQYVINSVTKWMPGWKKKGWKKADGKPVLNQDLLKQMDAELAARKSSGRMVSFTWVKGHAGHPLNEAADKRANDAAQRYSKGEGGDAGPGFDRETAGVLDADTPDSATSPAQPSVQEKSGQQGTVRAKSMTGEDAEEGAPQLIGRRLEEDRRTVLELERSLADGPARFDLQACAELIHHEFLEIGSSGRRYNRATILDLLAQENPEEHAPLEVQVMKALPLGPDHLHVVYRSVSPERAVLRSSIWRRTPEAAQPWQILWHQGTVEA